MCIRDRIQSVAPAASCLTNAGEVQSQAVYPLASNVEMCIRDRYTTFEYPICFFTMRNGCSTLQRTADFSCSIFLSQLRPVSYTHLDVYKRQDAVRYASTDQLLFMNGCDHQPVQTEDVYKRQLSA